MFHKMTNVIPNYEKDDGYNDEDGYDGDHDNGVELHESAKKQPRRFHYTDDLNFYIVKRIT